MEFNKPKFKPYLLSMFLLILNMFSEFTVYLLQSDYKSLSLDTYSVTVGLKIQLQKMKYKVLNVTRFISVKFR